MNRLVEPHPIHDACLPVHCWEHDVDEIQTPTSYKRCFECKHVYQTAQDLIDAYNQVVAEMNADGARRYGAEHEPRPPRTSAEDIYFCQHCMHDF